MLRLIANLVFSPPDWPVLLAVVTGCLLTWELAALLLTIRRRYRGGRAVGVLAAAVLLGPVLAPLAALRAASGNPAAWSWCLRSLRGTLLLTGAVLAAFRPVGGSLLVITACGVLWAIRSYRRTTGPLATCVRAGLIAARVAVVLMLAVWVAGPQVLLGRETVHRRKVLLGVDVSASMQREDVETGSGEPASRIDAVRNVLQDARNELGELLAAADVVYFPFDATPSPPRILDAVSDPVLEVPPADGRATAVGDAAHAVFDEYLGAGQDVAAVVLLTDGSSNTADVIPARRWAELMGARGVPVHTFGVGSESVTASTRTLTVQHLGAPEEVEAFNRLPISATIEAMGLEGETVRVTCFFGEERVGSEEFRLAKPRVSHPVRFVHVPLAPGYRRLRVSAELVDESSPPAGMPEATRLVHVVDRDIRILYVEGRFRFESKFIAQALSGAARLRVDRRVLLEPLASRPTPPIGEDLDDWLSYHAIIFGDVSAAHFSTRQLEIVRQLVGEYGKGFCMIGGQEAFGAGGWADTAVTDILPVDLGASRGHLDGPVRVVPTPAAAGAEWMRIAPDEPLTDAWERLGALPGANRLVGPKPAAVVLAEGGDDQPLIVSQQYGSGRALAIAFDTTWRWVLSPDDTADLQRRFWRQVALYLAAPKGNIWIVTDRTSYEYRRLTAGKERIEITAGLEDSTGRAVSSTETRVTLRRPDGRESAIQLEADGPLRRGKLPEPLTPGTYALAIEGRVEGVPLSAEHQFEVVLRDLESREVLADFDLLRAMAEASGGRFRPAGELPEGLRELRPAVRSRVENVTRPIRLSDAAAWPVILAIIALLCAEWALRKRKGLV